MQVPLAEELFIRSKIGNKFLVPRISESIIQNYCTIFFLQAAGVKYWIQKGADPQKMNLGLATYGRCFTLADRSNTQLYAPTKGPGLKGPYTRAEGFLGYNEVS